MSDALPALPTNGAATTGSGGVQRVDKIDARHRLMAEYMAVGCSHEWGRRATGKPNGTPLSLDEAAKLCRVRVRQARRIFATPAFKRLLAQHIEDLRSGHKLEAVHTQIAVMRKPGDRAADAKVRLEAAAAVLGEQGDKRSGVTVNVGVGVQVSPGYVIRLPGREEPQTIEGEERKT